MLCYVMICYCACKCTKIVTLTCLVRCYVVICCDMLTSVLGCYLMFFMFDFVYQWLNGFTTLYVDTCCYDFLGNVLLG